MGNLDHHWDCDCDSTNIEVGIMKDEKIGLSGEIEFKHFSPSGELLETIEIHNLVVNAGLEFVSKLINGVATNFFDYIAIGTGTTAATATDTQLETEITTGGGERALGTLTYEASYKAKFENTFNFTSSFAVTESGILDASTAGNMLCRQTFSAINVANGDSLQVTWKITVS